MSKDFWIFLLIILMSIVVFVAVGIVLWFKITYRYKNSLVVRIHNADTTVTHHRFFRMPIDNQIKIDETDNEGHDVSFTYNLKIESIEKGFWGRYIDFDYHLMNPINPRNRYDFSSKNFLNELKELFKLIGAMLDTNLHVKLLRNDKFESLVKMLLTIILIVSIIGASCACIGMIKSFGHKKTDNKCILTLDNQTWQTLYVGTHISPSSALPIS